MYPSHHGGARRVSGGTILGFSSLAWHVSRGGVPAVTALLMAINAAVHYLSNGTLIASHALVPAVILQSLGLLPQPPLRLFAWSLSPLQELQRLVVSQFLHADDIHLIYNLLSLLQKGRALEPLLGSRRFATLVGLIVLWSGVLHTAIAFVLAEFFHSPGALVTPAVGFSAVLFGLSYTLTRSDRWTFCYGIPVRTFALPWIELVLLHLLVPNSSFVGHLSGIIAGAISLKSLASADRFVGQLLDVPPPP